MDQLDGGNDFGWDLTGWIMEWLQDPMEAGLDGSRFAG